MYKKGIIFVFVLGLVSVPAFASIPGVFNTGVDANGAALGDEVLDSHWTLISSADPTYNGPETYTVKSDEWPIPPWMDNTSVSKWICPRQDETNVEPGVYVYQLQFDLTGYYPDSAVITGRYSSDDGLNDVKINGLSTGHNETMFNEWHDLSISSGFTEGINTLEFLVQNNDGGGGEANPSGLRVELSVTAGVLTDQASNPSPANTEMSTALDADLSWAPGIGAVSHDIYFGTDFNDVNQAIRLAGDINGDGPVSYLDLAVIAEQWLTNPGSSYPSADLDGDGDVNLVEYTIFADDWLEPFDAEFKGNQPAANTTYTLPSLSPGSTYYWRIDAVGSAGGVVKGEVWKFTVTDPLLFSFFKGVGTSGVYLAYSYDGLQWTELNGGNPVVTPTITDRTRDPSILRGPDGTFHLVFTGGWDYGVTKFGYSSSTDLINWTTQKAVEVMENEPNAVNCWAPELFYDDVEEEYMIVWSSTIPGRYPETDGQGPSELNHRIYYCTTTDFVTFSASALLYNDGFNVIDAAIVKDANQYVMFIKDETNYPFVPEKNIRMAFSANAQGPYGPASEPITGDYWCEGPSAIKIGNYWHVYFDKYVEGAYGVVISPDLENWEDISHMTDFPDSFNHGTVFTAPMDILNNLLDL